MPDMNIILFYFHSFFYINLIQPEYFYVILFHLIMIILLYKSFILSTFCLIRLIYLKDNHYYFFNQIAQYEGFTI